MPEVPGFVLIFLAVVWLALASTVAGVCRLRGHGGGWGFAISLVCSPVLGFLYAAALPDRHRGVEDADRARRLMEPMPDASLGRADARTTGKAVGSSRERIDIARKECRLCPSCMAIALFPLKSGDKCAECSRPVP